MFRLTHLVALFVTLFAFLNALVLAAPHHTSAVKAKRNVPLSSSDIDTFLDAHNVVRAQHSAAPLTWSPSLALKAAFWANLCLFKNSEGALQTEPYGEHIVAGTGDFPIRAAVGTFIGDKDQYNPAKPVLNHWTQVVWKSTTELGCAISKCQNVIKQSPGRETLYVCLYNPAGNVIGQAPENVQV
ncbi:CAP domain-containing protein [Ephemerocybe angulata]|uniref:CAP domain-containing protein n=1 Tax=Ephemerocybe angulata TaxID=980116 RepID=A0A8H6MAQ6_9AGAR|nr:CAP domain-containing protein [Tulosesus angulatus]